MINTSRIKNKRIGKIIKTEEQLAKQKLFEISYLCDEKDVDDSEILIADHNRLRPIVGYQTRRQTEIIDSIRKKKSTSFNLRDYRTLQSEVMDLDIQKVSLSPHYSIFNTVSSSKVFVGTKQNAKFDHHQREDSKYNLVLTKKKEGAVKIPKIPSQLSRQIQTDRVVNPKSQRGQIDSIIRKIQKANMRSNFYQPFFSLQRKNKEKQNMEIKFKEKIRNYIPLSLKQRLANFN